jgi:hypothetical protein
VGRHLVAGLELAAGYLVAWVVRKARRAGQRLDEETDEIIDASLDRLHQVIAAKLGTDPALMKLETEVSQGLEPSDPTVRRVQDGVEEATEEDPQFAAVVEAALVQLERVRGGASLTCGMYMVCRSAASTRRPTRSTEFEIENETLTAVWKSFKPLRGRSCRAISAVAASTYQAAWDGYCNRVP